MMKIIDLWIVIQWWLSVCHADTMEVRGVNPTVTSTVWWTPTTSYQSIYTGTTISTVVQAVTQQPNVVVTLTSYIPCPITSTTWVYEYGSCCQPTTVVTSQIGQVGVTTETLYTTVTPEAIVSTITTNGYVVVVVGPATGTSTATGQAQVINAQAPTSKPAFWIFWIIGVSIILAGFLC